MSVTTPVVYEFDVNVTTTPQSSPGTAAPIAGSNRLALLYLSFERASGGAGGQWFQSVEWAGVAATEVFRCQTPAEPSTLFRGGLAIWAIEEAAYPASAGTVVYTHDSANNGNDVHCALIQVANAKQADLTRIATQLAASLNQVTSTAGWTHTDTTAADGAQAFCARMNGDKEILVPYSNGETTIAECQDVEFTSIIANRAVATAGSYDIGLSFTNGGTLTNCVAWHLEYESPVLPTSPVWEALDIGDGAYIRSTAPGAEAVVALDDPSPPITTVTAGSVTVRHRLTP